MHKERNVVIQVARCRHRGTLFALRFEEYSRGRWAANWAFPMREQVAGREGYDRSQIKGEITLTAEYPGCPYCEELSILKCPCGKVACWDGETRHVTCPWCGHTASIEGRIDSLETQGDA